MASSDPPPSTTRLTPTLRTSASEPALPEHSSSGRVAYDARGNAVWEMRTEDDRFSRDSSTTLVRKLQATPLSIEDTAFVRRQSATPVTKPLPLPAHKRAVPEDAGFPQRHDRAQLGTVRTYPVKTSGLAKQPAPANRATVRGNQGLLDRLFGRKP